jgi:hypothetical protein
MVKVYLPEFIWDFTLAGWTVSTSKSTVLLLLYSISSAFDSQLLKALQAEYYARPGLGIERAIHEE